MQKTHIDKFRNDNTEQIEDSIRQHRETLYLNLFMNCRTKLLIFATLEMDHVLIK